MKFPVGNRQPVRGVFRCILGQDNIQCAVRIQLEVGAVVDAVAVDGIVNEEIILSVGGHGPEAALQRGRKGFKVERILLFSGQRCAGLIHRCLGIDRHVHGVGAKPHQRYHRAVGILRAEVADGLAVIDPLTEFLRILRAVGGKRGAKPLKHLRPALGSSFAQEGGVKGLARAHIDGGELLQQLLIRIGGRVDLHQSVRRIEKLCWRHGKHLAHGNKVIFLFISSLWCGILASLYISRKRQELHLLLNGTDIGQILVPGQHRAGDRPHRCGGHVHARHTVGQLALPAGKRDGISTRLVQHGGGVRPRIQKLHIAEAICLRQNVDHRLFPDVKPRLRIDGIDVRRHNGAERGVRQLLCMVELIDGRTASHGSVRIGR